MQVTHRVKLSMEKHDRMMLISLNVLQYFTGYSVGKAAVKPALGVEASDVTLFSAPAAGGSS